MNGISELTDFKTVSAPVSVGERLRIAAEKMRGLYEAASIEEHKQRFGQDVDRDAGYCIVRPTLGVRVRE
jgi:hypothetical protein